MTSSTVTPDLLDALVRTAERDGVEKSVVGAVIADEGGKVLLLHRPADDYLGGLWEMPSGGVEPGESLIEALRREVAEETGLTVAEVGGYLGHFDYRSGSGRRTRQFNFVAVVTGQTIRLTEHDAHLWADEGRQGEVSSAVRTVLDTWRRQAV
ncbi:NUDIX domain-containing protein [Streptomyces sp. NPDC021100]|uniref:NUDIX domain-containing protein n=1 Tax=Streptomyces sp. NPDC021100 TaxID=3365114 RepID=UPI0037986531